MVRPIRPHAGPCSGARLWAFVEIRRSVGEQDNSEFAAGLSLDRNLGLPAGVDCGNCRWFDCRAQTKLDLGLCFDGPGDVRYFDSEFCPGANAGPVVLAISLLAAAIAVAGIPEPEYDFARADPLGHLHCLHCQVAPGRPAGSAE